VPARVKKTRFFEEVKEMHVELIAITRYLRGDGTPEELLNMRVASVIAARTGATQGDSCGRASARGTRA